MTAKVSLTAPPMTGARLVELRRRKGRTQAQVAGLVGVTESTIKRWEAGRSPISLAMTRLLLVVLA